MDIIVSLSAIVEDGLDASAEVPGVIGAGGCALSPDPFAGVEGGAIAIAKRSARSANRRRAKVVDSTSRRLRDRPVGNTVFQTRTRDLVEHESFRSFSIGRYDEFPKTAHPKRRGDRDATPYPLARALDEDGLARLASWKSRRIAVSLVEPAAEFPRLPRHDASPIHRGAPRGGRPGPHL